MEFSASGWWPPPPQRCEALLKLRRNVMMAILYRRALPSYICWGRGQTAIATTARKRGLHTQNCPPPPQRRRRAILPTFLSQSEPALEVLHSDIFGEAQHIAIKKTASGTGRHPLIPRPMVSPYGTENIKTEKYMFVFFASTVASPYHVYMAALPSESRCSWEGDQTKRLPHHPPPKQILTR